MPFTDRIEIHPRVKACEDESVLQMAHSESRVLLTEDKDFGLLTFAGRRATAGVVLIRFPGGVRTALGQTIADVVHELGDRIAGAFASWSLDAPAFRVRAAQGESPLTND